MTQIKELTHLELLSISEKQLSAGIEDVTFHTNNGSIISRFHPSKDGTCAVVWVGGAGGGLDGPANNMYGRLSEKLVDKNIASLRLDYRFPNFLEDCIIDTLLGIEYLKIRDYSTFILAGHSFGGAVVISAGALSDDVAGVIALSSQTYGTDLVHKLSPKPVLFVHGKDDEVLPYACSEELYSRAVEPKKIILYNNCRHGLDECRERVEMDLIKWVEDVAK
jgi:hypothetical protein